MKLPLLFVATTSLLWAGCRDSNPSLPSPASISKPTQASVTTPVSLTQVAQPQPTPQPNLPTSATGTPIVIPSANLSNDTIYFNQTSLLQKRAFEKHIGGMVNGYEFFSIYYKSKEPKMRESFTLYAPAKIGRHTTQAMREPTHGLTPSFGIVNIDVIAGSYSIDPTADNWIEVTHIDTAKKAVTGRFSIHLIRDLPATTSTPSFETEYPKKVLMHGNFAN